MLKSKKKKEDAMLDMKDKNSNEEDEKQMKTKKEC